MRGLTSEGQTAQGAARFDARRFILMFLALSVPVRLVTIFASGLRDDETYTVVLARVPALSYYDHPPLHHWILQAFVAAFGEGRVDRLPFLALNLATSLALFGLARRVFSSAAGWWTLFAFNACLYFLLLPEGCILPDQPLLMFLALAAWAVAEILYGPPGRESRLWPLAGLAFGLAGLSKYSAALAPLGLAGFLVFSPQHRRWLADPRPYFAALLGLAVFAPAVIWNAQHGWVSFAFQSGRVASRLTLDASAWRKFADGLIAQVGLVTPWMLWPILAGMLAALREPSGSPGKYLLWLAAPPLIVFAAMPLLNQRAIAHWFDSGWLFAFPLAGAWLAARTPLLQRRFAVAAAALALAGAVVNVVAINYGGGLFPNAPDPGRHNREWPAEALRDAYRRAGAEFALIDDWRTGGRLGFALGPEVAICGMGPHARGYGYTCDAAAYLGRDALIVRDASNGTGDEERAFFRELTPLGENAVGPPGGHQLRLILRAGRELRTPPYAK